MQKISKKEWVDAVNRELKTRQWEDVFVELTDEIQAPPAYHSADTKDQYWTAIQTYNHFKPALGIELMLNNSSADNQRLLKLLNQGLDAPGLSQGTQWDGNYTDLFKEVHLDWLTWFIRDSDDIKAYFDQVGQEKYWEIKSPHHLSGNLREVMGRFVNILSHWSGEVSTSRRLISVEIDENYFKSISMLRALRRMHRNYSAALNLAHVPFYLNVVIDPSMEVGSEENRLITLTTMAMSASIGGADRIEFRSSSDSSHGSFYDRIGLNIMHILQMESHFSKVQDPLCGSWWVEKTTDLLAEFYWKELQSM